MVEIEEGVEVPLDSFVFRQTGAEFKLKTSSSDIKPAWTAISPPKSSLIQISHAKGLILFPHHERGALAFSSINGLAEREELNFEPLGFPGDESFIQGSCLDEQGRFLFLLKGSQKLYAVDLAPEQPTRKPSVSKIAQLEEVGVDCVIGARDNTLWVLLENGKLKAFRAVVGDELLAETPIPDGLKRQEFACLSSIAKSGLWALGTQKRSEICLFNFNDQSLRTFTVPREISATRISSVCMLPSEKGILFACHPDNPEKDYVQLCLLENFETPKIIQFADPCCSHPSSSNQFYFLRLPETGGFGTDLQDFIILANYASPDIGICGRLQADGSSASGVFQTFYIDNDEGLAQLPFVRGDVTYPFGLALDLSSTKPLVDSTDLDAAPYPPSPILWILSSSGHICPYNLLKLNRKEPWSFMKKSVPQPQFSPPRRLPIAQSDAEDTPPLQPFSLEKALASTSPKDVLSPISSVALTASIRSSEEEDEVSEFSSSSESPSPISKLNTTSVASTVTTPVASMPASDMSSVPANPLFSFSSVTTSAMTPSKVPLTQLTFLQNKEKSKESELIPETHRPEEIVASKQDETKVPKTIKPSDTVKAKVPEIIKASDTVKAKESETANISDVFKAKVPETIKASDTVKAKVPETIKASDTVKAKEPATFSFSPNDDSSSSFATSTPSSASFKTAPTIKEPETPALASIAKLVRKTEVMESVDLGPYKNILLAELTSAHASMQDDLFALKELAVKNSIVLGQNTAKFYQSLGALEAYAKSLEKLMASGDQVIDELNRKMMELRHGLQDLLSKSQRARLNWKSIKNETRIDWNKRCAVMDQCLEELLSRMQSIRTILMSRNDNVAATYKSTCLGLIESAHLRVQKLSALISGLFASVDATRSESLEGLRFNDLNLFSDSILDQLQALNITSKQPPNAPGKSIKAALLKMAHSRGARLLIPTPVKVKTKADEASSLKKPEPVNDVLVESFIKAVNLTESVPEFKATRAVQPAAAQSAAVKPVAVPFALNTQSRAPIEQASAATETKPAQPPSTTAATGFSFSFNGKSSGSNSLKANETAPAFSFDALSFDKKEPAAAASKTATTTTAIPSIFTAPKTTSGSSNANTHSSTATMTHMAASADSTKSALSLAEPSMPNAVASNAMPSIFNFPSSTVNAESSKPIEPKSSAKSTSPFSFTGTIESKASGSNPFAGESKATGSNPFSFSAAANTSSSFSFGSSVAPSAAPAFGQTSFPTNTPASSPFTAPSVTPVGTGFASFAQNSSKNLGFSNFVSSSPNNTAPGASNPVPTQPAGLSFASFADSDISTSEKNSKRNNEKAASSTFSFSGFRG